MKKNVIGLVSGIGPLAGLDVLKKIYAYSAEKYSAHQDEEYPDVIMLNHGIGVDALAHRSKSFHDGIMRMVKQIQDGGANVVGIACNTAHIYFDNIKIRRNIVLVNLIEEVALVAKKTCDNRPIGLLTSHGTRDQKLYHKYLAEQNVNFVEVNDEQQDLLDKTIDLVMAHREKEAAKYLKKVIDELSVNGVEEFLLGCTELPIAYDCIRNSNYHVLDANWVLAQCLVDEYMNSKPGGQ